MALDEATLISDFKQIEIDAKNRDLYPNGMSDETYATLKAAAIKKFVMSGTVSTVVTGTLPAGPQAASGVGSIT